MPVDSRRKCSVSGLNGSKHLRNFLYSWFPHEGYLTDYCRSNVLELALFSGYLLALHRILSCILYVNIAFTHNNDARYM
jgi:hypothetical protein